MNFRLQTDNPEFEGDLCDVLRLFYGDVALTQDEDAPAFSHTLCEENGAWIDTFAACGKSVQRRTAIEAGHPLKIKRARKRAVKGALYELCKQVTGKRPPWGSLTGIRPTRLVYEGLESGLTFDQSLSRMQTEFDVSADRAALLGEIVRMQEGILYPRDDEFDLYIGIPFCRTRCSYCSFASGEIGDGKLVQPYVDALCREIELSARMMRERGLKLRAGYIGGGTPTAISCAQLERILSEAQRAFPGAAEWTVEAGRPDTIDRDKLQMLRDNAVTRISINPQTFCDETLRRIGRAHTGAEVVEAYALARSMGFDDVNMDLITALPGEDEAIFARTLDRVIELDPESVTVHTLAIKRSSKMHEEIVVNRDDTDRTQNAVAENMTRAARERLGQSGYRPYYLYRQKYMAGNLENVGYAKPGRACLYNIGNMEETASVLALGAGAITKWLYDREAHAIAEGYDPEAMKFANLQLRIERAPNVRNVQQYIERVEEMVERKRKLVFPE